MGCLRTHSSWGVVTTGARSAGNRAPVEIVEADAMGERCLRPLGVGSQRQGDTRPRGTTGEIGHHWNQFLPVGGCESPRRRR